MIKATWLIQQQSNLGNTTPNQSRVGGWSESWYFNVDPNVAPGIFQNLTPFRAALLTSAARIVGQRYQILGGGSSTGGLTVIGSFTGQADVPQMAAEIRAVSSTTVNIRRYTLRGLADARVVEGEFQPSSAWTTSFNAFVQACFRYGVLFKARDLSAPQAGVVSIDTSGNMQLDANFPVSLGDEIRFLRVRYEDGAPVIGTTFVSTITDGTHIKIAPWTGQVAMGGSVRVVQPDVFCPIDPAKHVVTKVGVRKVGRPFTAYRGRRSASRHRQQAVLAP